MDERETAAEELRRFVDGDPMKVMTPEWATVPVALIEKTIALLKREPVKPEVAGFPDSPGERDMTYFYVCGACGGAIDYKDRFCRHCGEAASWQ